MGERVTVCEVGPRDASLAGRPDARVASGNLVTFTLEAMEFTTAIDLDRLVTARGCLRDRLPAEPRHGAEAHAGLPRTFEVAA